MEILKGIGASPGIAIGPVFLLDAKNVKTIRKRLHRDRIKQEKRRFKTTVETIEEQLNRLISELPDEIKEHSGILRSHILMLRDRMIYDKTLEIIEEERINAEWAMDKALQQVKAIFSNIEDAYIRERLEDIEFVVNKVKAVLAGRESPLTISQIEKPVITRVYLNSKFV